MSPQQRPHVVSIGGGTGLACLLKGLKCGVDDRTAGDCPDEQGWIARLTAVVTVTDDGGSSGRLRDELRVLPPGDIRNCLVALGADESLLSHLFQYRFPGTGQLQGHSFGNLFLTALAAVTGDFLKAVRLSSHVLAVRGRIYPATLDDVRLEALMADGTRVRGESAITRLNGQIRRISLIPKDCRPVRGVLAAIRSADIITLGPGSLYTSLLPNLLVKGIAREIRRSRAVKIYIGNLMTQPGETVGFAASDHVEVIYDHAGRDLFDCIVLNTRPIAPRVLARYRREGAVPVTSDRDKLKKLGLRILEHELLAGGRLVRHNSLQLADAVRGAWLRRRETKTRAGAPSHTVRV